MLGAAVWLMLSSILYSLRLSNGGGSFPKPLSAKEEQHYLALAAQGDLEARNVLIDFRAQRKSASDVSLSDYIETGKDGAALSLMDVVCSDEDLFERMSDKEIYARLYEKIDRCLDERERQIILARYGIGNRKPLTQREVADRCGISRSYVSRIEKKALKKLEAALEE